jgi:L-arabinokinase
MTYSASASGRLDVMGGIADYSGSLVLQMPISQQTHASVSLNSTGFIDITSQVEGEILKPFNVPLHTFLPNSGSKVDLEYAKAWFQDKPEWKWAAYPIGCLLVFLDEFKLSTQGISVYITSDVPLGKGVSSSASLEIAILKALYLAFEVKNEGTLIARLGQKAENLVVGAPCGLMDQLASYFGKPGHLLPILCQPDCLYEPILIPENLHFPAIDSGVRHAVTNASYSDVRTAAFMGYSIIAFQMGASQADLEHARQSGDWSQIPLKGYLANMPPSDFELLYSKTIPDRLSGHEFLQTYSFSIDTVTHIVPDKTYPVKVATAHPIYENCRVKQFKILLTMARLHPSKAVYEQMGELMVQSHQSYSACGLGTTQTDRLVTLALEKRNQGVYGAKITGGGSGGTVCFLAVGDEGKNAVGAIHRQYQQEVKKSVVMFES